MFYAIIERERISFHERSMCSGSPTPDIWHSTEPLDIAQAKAVCRQCPVRVECLNYSIHNNERFGVWGGLDHDERGFFHKTRF